MPSKREIVDCVFRAAFMSRALGWGVITPLLEACNLQQPTQSELSEHPALFAALLLERLACPLEGTVAAATALRRSPQCERAKELLGRLRPQAFLQVIAMTHKFHEETARLVLACLVSALRGLVCADVEQGVLALFEMMDDARVGPIRTNSLHGRPHLIDLPIFGEWFVGKATSHILPCLLAAGNVPALSRYGTVILNIHCRKQDEAHFVSLPILIALSAHCRVNLIPMSKAVERLTSSNSVASTSLLARLLMSTFRYVSLMTASRLGADFSCVGADQLCSAAFFAECKTLLTSGYGVVCDHYERVDESKMAELMMAADFESRPALALPAEWLYQATLRAAHPNFINSFMRVVPNRLAVDPVLYYVRTPRGFTKHCFQYALSGVAASVIPKDLRCNFSTPDGRLLSDLLRDRDRAATCHIQRSEPGSRFACHVDTPRGASQFDVNTEVTPENAALRAMNWVARPWDCEHFAWAIRQGIRYGIPADAEAMFPPDEGLDPVTIADRSANEVIMKTSHMLHSLADFAQMTAAVHMRFNELRPLIAKAENI